MSKEKRIAPIPDKADFSTLLPGSMGIGPLTGGTATPISTWIPDPDGGNPGGGSDGNGNGGGGGETFSDDNTPSAWGGQFDPKFVEGSGGGPATPLGGPNSPPKSGVQGTLFWAGVGYMTLGALYILAGAMPAIVSKVPASAVNGYTALGTVFTIIGQVLVTLSGDPPNPDFRHPIDWSDLSGFDLQSVSMGVECRSMRPHLAHSFSLALETHKTARAALFTVESAQGASIAGDRDWEATHRFAAEGSRAALGRVVARWAMHLPAEILGFRAIATPRLKHVTSNDVEGVISSLSAQGILDDPIVVAHVQAQLEAVVHSPGHLDKVLQSVPAQMRQLSHYLLTTSPWRR